MTRMEFSGFIRHSRLCIFQMWFHTVRKVDQPRGALAISEHRLETSLRYLKFNGTSVDSNWTWTVYVTHAIPNVLDAYCVRKEGCLLSYQLRKILRWGLILTKIDWKNIWFFLTSRWYMEKFDNWLSGWFSSNC